MLHFCSASLSSMAALMHCLPTSQASAWTLHTGMHCVFCYAADKTSTLPLAAPSRLLCFTAWPPQATAYQIAIHQQGRLCMQLCVIQYVCYAARTPSALPYLHLLQQMSQHILCCDGCSKLRSILLLCVTLSFLEASSLHCNRGARVSTVSTSSRLWNMSAQDLLTDVIMKHMVHYQLLSVISLASIL